MRILKRDLRLADTAKAMQGEHYGRPLRVQLGAELAQVLLPAGEERISSRAVEDLRLGTRVTELAGVPRMLDRVVPDAEQLEQRGPRLRFVASGQRGRPHAREVRKRLHVGEVQQYRSGVGPGRPTGRHPG